MRQAARATPPPPRQRRARRARRPRRAVRATCCARDPGSAPPDGMLRLLGWRARRDRRARTSRPRRVVAHRRALRRPRARAAPARATRSTRPRRGAHGRRAGARARRAWARARWCAASSSGSRARAATRSCSPAAATSASRCPTRRSTASIDALARHLRRLPGAEPRALLPADVARAGARCSRCCGASHAVRRRAAPPVPSRPTRSELRRRAFAALRELLARLAERAPARALHRRPAVGRRRQRRAARASCCARPIAPPAPARARRCRVVQRPGPGQAGQPLLGRRRAGRAQEAGRLRRLQSQRLHVGLLRGHRPGDPQPRHAAVLQPWRKSAGLGDQAARPARHLSPQRQGVSALRPSGGQPVPQRGHLVDLERGQPQLLAQSPTRQARARVAGDLSRPLSRGPSRPRRPAATATTPSSLES